MQAESNSAQHTNKELTENITFQILRVSDSNLLETNDESKSNGNNTNKTELIEQLAENKQNSITNRFRFIKVDRSYTRGRWKCDDYADSEQNDLLSTAVEKDQTTQILQNIIDEISEKISSVDHRYISPGHLTVSDIQNAEKTKQIDVVGIRNVELFYSDEEIDSKIEAAMDLVKSHLTLAVREEVKELKEQIKRLQNINLRIERENAFLRQRVNPELLAEMEKMNFLDNLSSEYYQQTSDNTRPQ